MMYRSVRQQAGDTIIEVLVAIAVVSAVLGSVFTTVNRISLNARQAQEHEEALKIAETQIELLGHYVRDTTHAAIPVGAVFCFSALDGSYHAMTAANLPQSDRSKYGSACKQTVDSNYDYYFGIWNNGGVYRSIVAWDGAKGDDQQVEVLYKIYSSVPAQRAIAGVHQGALATGGRNA